MFHVGTEGFLSPQALLDFIIRVDSRVCQNFRIHKLAGRGVGIGIVGEISAFCRDFRLQDVVDELVCIVHMLGIGRNAPEINPHGRARSWKHIGKIEVNACLLGRGLGSCVGARTVGDEAKVLVGYVVQIIRGAARHECCDVGGNGH